MKKCFLLLVILLAACPPPTEDAEEPIQEEPQHIVWYSARRSSSKMLMDVQYKNEHSETVEITIPTDFKYVFRVDSGFIASVACRSADPVFSYVNVFIYVNNAFVTSGSAEANGVSWAAATYVVP